MKRPVIIFLIVTLMVTVLPVVGVMAYSDIYYPNHIISSSGTLGNTIDSPENILGVPDANNTVCHSANNNGVCSYQLEVEGMAFEAGSSFYLPQGSGICYSTITLNYTDGSTDVSALGASVTIVASKKVSSFTVDTSSPSGFICASDYVRIDGTASSDECYKYFDLISDGTLVSGEPVLRQATIDGSTHYIADFSYSVAVSGQAGGTGIINELLFDSLDWPIFNVPGEITITANGEETTVMADVLSGNGYPINLFIPGGGGTVLLNFHIDFPGIMQASPSVVINSIPVKIPSFDCGFNLLQDGGFEAWPGEYAGWNLVNPENYFGRKNDQYNYQITDGHPACGEGFQIVNMNASDYSSRGPVQQGFTWPGGTLYYKVRTRVNQGMWPDAPYVYIADNAGNVVVNLVGDGNYFATGNPLVPDQWALHRNTVAEGNGIDLEAGDYQIVLTDVLYNPSGIPMVAYDDVAISTAETYIGCDDLEILPTTTPTSTQNTPTPNPSFSPTVTSSPTKTAIFMGTWTPSVTSTRRSTATTTRTAKPTNSATAGPSPTRWGYKTNTPGPGATGTSTPWGPTSTNIAGIPPEPGGPGNNPVVGDCTRPADWYNVSGWVDYEFCRLFYAVTWQPSHSSTLAAVPHRYDQDPAIVQLNEIDNTFNDSATLVATYDWSDTGYTVDAAPDPSAFVPDASSPYNDGQITLSSQAGPSYSQYCNVNIGSLTGQQIAHGICWTLDLLKKRNILSVFQFSMYIFSALSIIHTTLSILKVRAKGG